MAGLHAFHANAGASVGGVFAERKTLTNRNHMLNLKHINSVVSVCAMPVLARFNAQKRPANIIVTSSIAE